MIFILGGNGFVGSAFRRFCERLNLPHVVIGRENYAQFAGQACDLLINANGNSKKFLASEQPLAEFDASVRSVCASLLDFQPRLYILLSSCDVYPDCSSPHVSYENLPVLPEEQSPYGFHKYLAEQCVRHAAGQWLIFRLGGLVGPGLKKNPIYDILHGGPLWLDLASELQYIHSDDAARIVFQLAGYDERGRLSNGAKYGEIFNLCGRGVITLEEVARQVDRPVYVRPGSPLVKYDVSIEKISGILNLPDTRSTVLEFVHRQLEEREEAA